jgi:hypothetical protein
MIMGKCLGGPEGFSRRSEVLEVGGSGGRRFWRSEISGFRFQVSGFRFHLGDCIGILREVLNTQSVM